ncbi:MAG: 2-succinyl-5-enolpyruvyl-6-hydroxy-3-cyclohexene-1-carboxylic-acid synthase [Acidimicrobiales bacterium]
MTELPVTAAATFCTTLADEWVRGGVTDAFVAPGSRSTPLALALAADDRLRLHVCHDERVAAFAALGHGLVTGRPAVVVCTSGTAATHFHAAVVEADLSSVPMVVCTADRPPELWDVGASQTIDQTHLYGDAVRFFAEPGVPDDVVAGSWRSLASRLVVEALGQTSRPGPVHANLAFRDPLVGRPGPLPPGRHDDRPWHRVEALRPPGPDELASPPAGGADVGAGAGADDRAVARLGSYVRAGVTAGVSAGARELAGRLVGPHGRARSGVIVAGSGTDEPWAAAALAERLGWPLVADHRSGCRTASAAVAHADALLRSERFAATVRPEVVVRIGEPLASKVVSQWLSASGAEVLWLGGAVRWSDPERLVGRALVGPEVTSAVLAALPVDVSRSDALERWRAADEAAAKAVAAVLADADPTNEITVARAVIAGLPPGAVLVTSSSMPVRDVEWYGAAGPGAMADGVEVHANRGANGIDGVVSTAIGVALTGRPTTVLIGDVAFLHDSNALIALGRRQRPDGQALDLHLVVVDNDGGGIFSFLPQASLLGADRFEALFGTPHGTDLATLVRAHGLPVTTGTDDLVGGSGLGGLGSLGGLGGGSEGAASTSVANGGVRVTIVTSDRTANVALHDRVNRAVVAAVEP